MLPRWKMNKGMGGLFAHYGRGWMLVMRNSTRGDMPLFFLRARGSVDGVNVYIYLPTYVWNGHAAVSGPKSGWNKGRIGYPWRRGKGGLVYIDRVEANSACSLSPSASLS